MRPRLAFVLSGVLAASCGLVVGCAAPAEPDERLGRGEDAIVNGSLDTVHQSAVAYLQGGKCTATIVEVDGSTGYALTAAHCINSQLGVLRQGNNHASGSYDVQYTVVDTERHPDYNQSALYDFAMLRFTGATSSTPFTPPLPKSLDTLSSGTQLDLVGYGQTESGGTTLRRHVIKPILQLTDLRILFNQSGSGMCSGDSGGPEYHSVQGTEYVGGVNVAVSQGGCVGSGAVGIGTRVSAVEKTFIRPYIDGTPYQLQTCDECTEAHTADGACFDETVACFDDTDCDAYVDCLQGCGTQVCVNLCKQMHPGGSQLYQQIFSCLCTTGCSAECSGDPQCEPPPACGIDWVDDTCESCADQACCSEQEACSVDATCMTCIGSANPDPSCETHPTAVALNDCLELACPTECASTTGAGGGAVGGASGVGGAGGGDSIGTAVGAGGSEDTVSEDDDLDVVEQDCGCTTPGNDRTPEDVALALLLGCAALLRRHQGSRRGGTRQS